MKPELTSMAAIQRVNEAARRYDRLARYREYQAEVIANHYAAHAKIAMELLRLIESKRYAENPDILDEAIEYNIKIIKQNHLVDFGIELDWKD